MDYARLVCMFLMLVLISGCVQPQGPPATPPGGQPPSVEPPAGEDVFVYTDQTQYKKTKTYGYPHYEIVKVSLFNNRSTSIYYYHDSCPACEVYPPIPPTIVEVKAGETINLSVGDVKWRALDLGRNAYVSQPPKAGKYKVEFEYYTDKILAEVRQGARTVFSNEFELVYTPPIDEGVFVSTDKRVYVKGEMVRITILNNRTETILYEQEAPLLAAPFYVYRAVRHLDGSKGLDAQMWFVWNLRANRTDRFVPFEAGNIINFEWNQTLYKYGKYVRIPGTYRIGFGYISEGTNASGSVYSEEFEVR